MKPKLYVCAKVPCKSCPYRQDVPSGIWHAMEYRKLPQYDGTMADQVLQGGTGVFECHQLTGQLCSGWVAAHGPENLVALRIWSARIHPSVWKYQTTIAVFRSGADAAAHGMRKIKRPDVRARRTIDQLLRKRARNADVK